MSAAYTKYSSVGALIREPLPPVPEQHVVELWLDTAHKGTTFTTLQGQRVRIMHPGTVNFYDGPDFSGGLVEIDGEMHAGPIEIHRRIEDWYLHNHQHNQRYNDVVLHVVLYPPDGPVPDTLPPTIVLSGDMSADQRRLQTLHRRKAPPFHDCYAGPHPNRATQTAAIVLAAETRFVRKCGQMELRAAQLTGGARHADGWLQCLYEYTARALGYGGNADALQQFASDVPLTLLRSMYEDRKPSEVHTVFTDMALSRRWNVKSVRPGNRITERLKHLEFLLPYFLRPQAAGLLSGALIQLSLPRPQDVLEQWASGSVQQIGAARVYEIAVNVVAPWLTAFAAIEGNHSLREAAIRLYFHSPDPPQNRHTRAWAKVFGLPSPFTSGTQQGIIELRTGRCTTRACTGCLMGKHTGSV